MKQPGAAVSVLNQCLENGIKRMRGNTLKWKLAVTSVGSSTVLEEMDTFNKTDDSTMFTLVLNGPSGAGALITQSALFAHPHNLFTLVLNILTL